MRLKELAEHFKAVLRDRYDEGESHAVFLMSIAYKMGYSRADYLLKRDEQVSAEHLDQLLNVLEGVHAGRPIQYIIGETEFFGLPFKVDESVLIPRPETEELVEWVLECVGKKSSAIDLPFGLLDIGTGSGCIAISLKKHVLDAEVFALDISEQSLSVASFNSILNQASIKFINADIRKFNTEQKFDVIVSNPPYITESEKSGMSEHVLMHEPHLALFAGHGDPLIFYDVIADFAVSNLTENGLLFFEINESLSKDTVDLLNVKGFKNIELRKDMQGKYRMIKCKRT